MKRHALLVTLLSCTSHDASAPAPAPVAPVAPAPAPAAPAPAAPVAPATSTSQLIEQVFGTPNPNAFADQLDTLRELAKAASPAERQLIDKMVRFAEGAARDPKNYAEIDRTYVALVGDLVAALGPNDYKLALKLVYSTYPVWSSTRYHGGFELDAPVERLFTDLATAHPDEPVPQAMIARLMNESGLDGQAGLAAAKRCLQKVANAEAAFRAQIEQECRRVHGELAAAFIAPRCKRVRDDLTFYRGGPKKSEIDPTQAVIVDGRTFYRWPTSFTDSSHVTSAMQSERSLTFQLDPGAAEKAEELRGSVAGEDDWIIVEGGGTPLLAGGWDLDFGRLGVVGAAGHAPRLELVCKTIERRTLPPELAL